MLVEIIIASVIAIGIGYYLINLTFNFSDKNDDLYESVYMISDKTVITKSIMNDLEGEVISDINKVNDYELDFKVNGEERRLSVNKDKNVIEYGKYENGGYVKGDKSYYYKKLNSNINIKGVNIKSGYISGIQIVFSNIYADKDYYINLPISTSTKNYMINGNNDCNVADNSSVYFATLADAFNYEGNNYTVCVIEGCVDSSTATLASGKTVILDLNGKTITRTAYTTNNGALTIRGTSGTFTANASTVGDKTIIINNGTLNIGASGSTGFTISKTYNSGTTSYYTKYLISNSGTLNIVGGTVQSTDRAVWSVGTLNMTGGTVKTIAADGGAPIYINSNSGNTSATISGGTVTSAGTEANWTRIPIWITGSNTTTLNISGSSTNITGLGGIYIYGGTANITVSGGTISATSGDNAYSAIKYQTGTSGMLKITGGTIQNSSDDYDTIQLNGIVSTTTMSGGTVKNNGNRHAIYSQSVNTGNITITGGTVSTAATSNTRYGVYYEGSGTLTIGDNSNAVSTTSPVINGGVSYTGTGKFYYYDGKFTKATYPTYNKNPNTGSYSISTSNSGGVYVTTLKAN